MFTSQFGIIINIYTRVVNKLDHAFSTRRLIVVLRPCIIQFCVSRTYQILIDSTKTTPNIHQSV